MLQKITGSVGLLLVTVLVAGNLTYAGELNYMEPYPEEQLENIPHVKGESYALPHDFVDGQWLGIIAASDGKTYFSVSSHSPNRNAQFYRYDPQKDQVEHLIDVGKWCGEEGKLAEHNTQGKIHSDIFEVDGKLYASTCPAHRSEDVDYPGGHFLAYDLKTGEFINLGRVEGENTGLLTMKYEPVYNRLYGIAQEGQTLYYYDLDTDEIVEVGSIEDNPHQCRMLIPDREGNIYGSTWGRMIYKYDPAADQMSALLTRLPSHPEVPRPTPDPESRAWRKTGWTPILYDPESEWWYGVTGHDENLFRLRLPEPDSHRAEIEALAYMGFQKPQEGPFYAGLGMVRQGRTLYYVSYALWEKRAAHLMSYDMETGEVTDHGPIITDGRRRVSEIHSLVVGSDGQLHAVAMVFSLEEDDPAKPWANRAQCYFHARFMTIDPGTDLLNQR